MTDDERDRWVDALNQQLARSAAEISRRSTTQQALQALHVSVVAGIVGLVASGRASELALLLVPYVAVTFGSQWFDNHGCIHRLGDHLAEQVEPNLRKALGDVPVKPFDLWETHIRAHRDAESTAIWKLPVVALFQGVALAGLVASFPSAVVEPGAHVAAPGSVLTEVGPRLLWLLAFVLTTVSCKTALWHFRPPA